LAYSLHSSLKHAKTLYGLKRRIVLDDARKKIATDYGLTLDQLRPRRSEVGALVARIRSLLTSEHSKLLSNEALTLIFDSRENSMREDGNKAAHEASPSDLMDALLEGTLTETQRALLAKIYYFAHGKEPDFVE
jgi:hypothetical protein